MNRNKKIGMILGLTGFVVWCISIISHAPEFVDKVTFFIDTLKNLSLAAYIMPVSFLLYALSAFLGRRVSVAAIGVLLVLMSGAYIYRGPIAGDLVGISVVSVLCFLFPVFAGKGRYL